MRGFRSMFAKQATALFIGGAALAGGSVAWAEGYKDAHSVAGEWRLPRPHYEVLVSSCFTAICLAVSLYLYVPKLLVPKIGTIIKNYFFPPTLKLPEWEEEIASRPGLKLQAQVSRFAQSSTDGALLVCMPRIYIPETPYSEEQEEEDKKNQKGYESRDVYCTWHFGKDAVGHPEIVHGGAIATAIDESCGHAFMALGRGLGFTAYLHVNYKKPTPAGIPLLITVKLKSIEGRKVTLDAVVSDGKQTEFADGSALFVVPRKKE